MTGCLPQYYLGKMSIFSSYTFHSLVYSPVGFFSVCGGFGLVFCCGVFVGFCLGFCYLVVVFLMFEFICVLSLGVLCVCACVWVFVVGFDFLGFGLFGVFLLAGWV